MLHSTAKYKTFDSSSLFDVSQCEISMFNNQIEMF